VRHVVFRGPLADRLSAYVEMRRRLGLELGSQHYILGKFDRLLAREMAQPGPVTREHVEAFLRTLDGLALISRRRQLSNVRQFLLYLRQFEPQTFLPDRSMQPAHSSPRAPHIYSVEEIRTLLHATLAFRIRPRGSFRPRVFHTLFALLYATGMRISEALALHLGDLDLRRAVIHIRKGKFRKARLIPVTRSTREGIERYLVARAERGHATTATSALFVTDRRRPVCYETASATFRTFDRAPRSCGGGSDRPASGAPRGRG
jgi:site-specific recombinase XerD